MAGAGFRPSAVQSTCRTPGPVSTSPRSSTIRSASMRRTRPSRTTSSICRTASSSPWLSIVPRNIVARCEGSMRKTRPERLEPFEEVVEVRGGRGRLGVEGDPLHDRADLVQRLEVLAIVEPHLARPDPPDAVGSHAVVEQPDAGVHGRLAGAEDGVGVRRLRGRRQRVDRDEASVRRDVEGRRVRRRDRRLQVPSVDDLAPDAERVHLTGGHVPDLLPVRVGPEMLVPGEDPDTPGRGEPLGRRGEVLADLGRRSPARRTPRSPRPSSTRSSPSGTELTP